MNCRGLWLGLMAVAAGLLLAAPADACPFCNASGQTLTQELNQASVILYGTLKNPMRGADDLYADGTTEMEIIEVLKPHEVVKDKKRITLSRYIPLLDQSANEPFLIFADVYKGKIDPFRGEPAPKVGKLLDYTRGLLKHKDDKPAARLRFFFDYLDEADPVITGDAYREFAYAEYKDLQEVYKALPDEKIAAWLGKERLPVSRIGLYGSMLAHCSKDPAKHAKLLRTYIDNAEDHGGIGIDGMIAGYILLQPKDGWALLLDIVKDPERPFTQRYPALKALRFFVSQDRMDVVSRKQALEAMTHLFAHRDLADLAIEDLRRWKWWEATEAVLPVKDKHDKPIIKRAVIRFALNNPTEAAKKFIAEQRKENNALVDEIADWLKYEEAPPAPTKPTTTPDAKKEPRR